jgi:hypothetical protein
MARKSFWWEQSVAALSPAVAAERRRVMLLIESHKDGLGPLYVRLSNIIANGLDLEAEMERPPEDRASGFTWPDQK